MNDQTQKINDEVNTEVNKILNSGVPAGTFAFALANVKMMKGINTKHNIAPVLFSEEEIRKVGVVKTMWLIWCICWR